MSLLPLEIKPGIYTETSARTALGRWKDGSNVRFFKGNLEKVGGWSKLLNTTFDGVCRSIWAWTTLGFTRYLALGTHTALYLTDLSNYFDITPIDTTGTLGANPFTTTLSSITVSVHHVAHGRSVGDHIAFSGATAVGGITPNGSFVVGAVPDLDHFTFDFTSPATSGATGAGVAVVFVYRIPVGTVDSIIGTGWGMGGWGSGTWGTPRTSGFLRLCRIWSLLNWGEALIASPIGRPIYVWLPSGGTSTPAVLITNAPAQNRRVLISKSLRILISFGSHDGSNPDPMLIRWCDSEDYTDWTPSVINLAGDKRLDNGNEIITALQSRDEIAVITDSTLYSMTQTGDNLVFGFSDKGQTKGLVGPNAAVDIDGTIYAMGRGGFYTYDGQIKLLPCDVHSRVFGDPDNPDTTGINYVQAAKTYCARNKLKDEIIWFFCSKLSNEIDSCVGYNYSPGDECWWLGKVARTAWLDETPFKDQFNVPVGIATLDGVTSQPYMQETGVDADGAALPYFAESYDVEINASNNLVTGTVTGAGQSVFRIKRIFPDFIRLVGNHFQTLKGRKFPNDRQVIKGPKRFGKDVRHIDQHMRSRQIAIRISGNEIGNDISTGQWRAESDEAGGR